MSYLRKGYTYMRQPCDVFLLPLLQTAWIVNVILDLKSNAGFRLACRSPLCRYAAWSSLAVSELALSPSGIAPELNRIQLSAICRDGQSGKVIDLLTWRCLPLGHPSAASGACAVVQISSSKRQCGKRQVSLKPALVSSPANFTPSEHSSLLPCVIVRIRIWLNCK